ncbi:transcriptional regulator [Sphaerisporangium album]|uniref:Transcriptional regulator n=1 Tax=Sphaerisporangium album TaxID=509200 RepID=A0A367FR76_9ACTN|nr:helix-turn-helix domain-containing protein [Sphaerisporangium album]RCG32771.1 transcriptional regulator [Sphaerisporangium album]
MIVILLDRSPRRFGDLHREIGGISKKVLIDTLRALERDGMIARPDPDDASAVYRLTPLGRTLREPLIALRQWAESHVDEVIRAQQAYDERHDGDLVADGDGGGPQVPGS